MSFYKIHTPVAIAAWDAMHQADAELRKQGTAFAELFVARPVFKNDVTSTSFHGIRFHGTTYVSESLWTQPTSNNGFCSWPKSKAPRGMSAEHKALMEIWNSNRPKKSVDVSAFYPAIGLDWEILFMTGFAMFRHTDTIYIETDAKPKSDAGAVEILGSEYNAAKQFSATLKLTPIATGRHRARFSWINRRCVMPANELKPTLADWLESGEYLPEFMRDFHDQKDVFKAMHHIIKNADENGNARDGHIYVVDTFLWYMARCGYTLQRSRKQVEFRDMEGDIDKMKKDVYSAFSKLVEAQHG